MKQVRTGNVPKLMEPLFEAVTAITDAFCREHLNQEYAELGRKLSIALCRKRPSPLSPGKEKLWACGIVYALGKVNFLGDKSFTPYLPLKEVPQLMGVAPSTAAAYARHIEHLFRMTPMDPRWCLPSLLDENPRAWLIMVNGFIVDARQMPREVQEEALRKGLIPLPPGRCRSHVPSGMSLGAAHAQILRQTGILQVGRARRSRSQRSYSSIPAFPPCA